MWRWTPIVVNALIAHAEAPNFKSLFASLPPNYIQDKFQEWTRSNPEVQNQMSEFQRINSQAFPDVSITPAPSRALQSLNCSNISVARDCCETNMCSICYGGIVWAFMSYMNWTDEFYKVYEINVSDEQKVTGNFCGMSWQDCSQLQDLALFDILDDKAKASFASIGISVPQYYEPSHCPFWIYQQLWNSAKAPRAEFTVMAVLVSLMWWR